MLLSMSYLWQDCISLYQKYQSCFHTVQLTDTPGMKPFKISETQILRKFKGFHDQLQKVPVNF